MVFDGGWPGSAQKLFFTSGAAVAVSIETLENLNQGLMGYYADQGVGHGLPTILLFILKEGRSPGKYLLPARRAIQFSRKVVN